MLRIRKKKETDTAFESPFACELNVGDRSRSVECNLTLPLFCSWTSA